MTKYQALIFRFILFLAGAGIVVLAFFLINTGRELNSSDTFIWTSIGVMYLIFFLPFFFSTINIGNFSAKIPSISMVWTGILFYIAASVIIIVLLIKTVISLNIAIIIQAILLFIYLINVYFSYFAASHISKTAEEEVDKNYYMTKIKSKAGVLLLSVNNLTGEYANAQKILKQSIDDIKYISPVDNDTGSGLEANILRLLNSISEIIGSVQGGAQNLQLENAANNLQSLVNERKLLRN
ncbi:MAG: hypothetical protein LBG94_02785 [Treponema sp.]|jgi:hypothetical protein|nr:hypothetical protein [Treponema sp.]